MHVLIFPNTLQSTNTTPAPFSQRRKIKPEGLSDKVIVFMNWGTLTFGPTLFTTKSYFLSTGWLFSITEVKVSYFDDSQEILDPKKP